MMSKASLNKTGLHPAAALEVYRLALRKNAVLSAVFAALLLIIQPTMQLIQYNRSQIWMEQGFELSVANEIYRYVMLPLSLVFMTLLLVRIFAYMHLPLEVDLWHQLPLRRRSLFVSKLLALLTLLIVPQIVNLLVYAFLRGGLRGQWSLVGYLGNFVQGQLMLVALLAMALCFFFMFGNSFDGLAAFFGFNLGWIILWLLYFDRLVGTWPGYRFDWSTRAVETAFIRFASPLAALFTDWDRESRVWPLYWFAFAALGLVLAAWLYGKRASEKSGSSGASSPLYRGIAVMGSTGAGLLLSTIFYSAWMSALSIGLGFLIGSLLAHIVIELIAARGPSTLLKSSRYYLLTLALALLGLAVMLFDPFGYARYSPKAEDLQAIVLDVNAPSYDQSGMRKAPLLLDASTDKAAVDKLLALQKELRTQGKSEASSLYRLGAAEQARNQIYERGGFVYTGVTLHMIDRKGKVHSRVYAFNSSDYPEAFSALAADPLVGSVMSPLQALDVRQTKLLELHSTAGEGRHYSETQLKEIFTEAAREELLNALVEDARAQALDATASPSGFSEKDKYGPTEILLTIEDPRRGALSAGHALTQQQAQALRLPYSEAYFMDLYQSRILSKMPGGADALQLAISPSSFPRGYALLKKFLRLAA